MTAEIFTDYFAKFCQQVKERPLLMILDGHLSHLSYETVKLAMKERVTLLKLPPHTTDLLQPLDKTCFRPFKIEWDKSLVKWQQANQRPMSKADFSDLLCSVWHKGITSETIVSGFLSCGIFPINRNKYPVKRLNPEKLKKYEEMKITARSTEAPEEEARSTTVATTESTVSAPVQPKNQNNPNDNSSTGMIQQQPATAEKRSFEDILLSKIRRTPSERTTRRKIHPESKVLTTEEFANSIADLEKPKKKKKIKKEPDSDDEISKKKPKRAIKKPKKD